MRWSEEVVGIDFSDDCLVATRVASGSPGSLRLLNLGWARLDPAASDDEWAAALRRIWRSAGGFSTRTVCASLRSRSALLRYFQYPALEPVELASALGLEAEDSLQLSREELVLDWHLAQSTAVAGSPKESCLEGLLVAAPRKHIQQQLDIMRMAGLYPVAVDLAAAALGNLHVATHPEPPTGEPVCILHLTGHRADMALLFGEKGLYARSLYARGASWDSSMAALVDGIQDALKYFLFKLGGQPVRKMWLSGPLPEQTGLLALLREKAGVTAEKWNPVARVVPGSALVRRRLAEADRPPLEISLGLALRRYDDE